MYDAMRETSWAFFGDIPWVDGRFSGLSKSRVIIKTKKKEKIEGTDMDGRAV